MSILQHVSAENSAPCLILDGHETSYAEAWAESSRLLTLFGGDRRLIALEACATPDFVFTYLAALRGRFPVALLPPGHSQSWDAFQRDFAPEISCRMREGRWEITERASLGCAPLHPDLAVMLATSGSEGLPRWVRLSQANIEANAASIVRFLGLTPEDRAPVTLPFHYSYGLSVLHTHLAAGGCLAFCGQSVIDPGFLSKAVNAGCTGLSGVPHTFALLERIGFRNKMWPSLRYMTVAGGRLPPETVRDYDKALRRQGAQLFVMYGQTEATARMAFVPPDLITDHPDCIGLAIPGGYFRILDEAGRPVTAAGETGDLHYSGPNVMMGYAGYRPDLARGAEVRELATGDIASLTGDGLLRLEGRASRFSKIAGIRVGHEALEWALRSKGVNCAVTGTDQAITVHLEEPGGPDIEALAGEIAGIPARFISLRPIRELPRLASGKFDYKALAAEAAPSTPDGGDLLDAYRAALYPKKVTAADSFESLEGDSLAYVQASLAVESRLGFLPDNWEQMPIVELEALKRPPATSEIRRTAKIESHVVLRAAAILLIVIHHATTLPIPGGAAALMVMVGYGFARFHGGQLFEGRTGHFLLPMLRNLVPYFAIVAGFAVVWDKVPWASVLLAGNFGFADPAQHTMLPFQFWFVEAYAQLCLLMAIAFSVRAVRRIVSERPFETAMLILLLAFSLRYTVPMIYDIGNRKIFTLPYVLWFAAMGWCAYFAVGKRQRLALLLTVGVLCPVAAYTGGNWQGAWILYMLQFGVVAVLLLAPQVRLPRAIIPGVMLISAASYHIYLFHRIVPEALGLDQIGAVGPIASIAVGLASGIAAFSLQRRLFARLSPGALPRETGRGFGLAPGHNSY